MVDKYNSESLSYLLIKKEMQTDNRELYWLALLKVLQLLQLNVLYWYFNK